MHDHKHGHENCCEHEHEHDHGHCCEHGHSHGSHACPCGCAEHESGKADTFLFVAGLIVLALSVILKESLVAPILAGLSAVLCGAELFKAGIKELSHFKFGELGLLTVAVGASFVLAVFGDDPFDCMFEAAMVTALFRVGEYLEDMAVEKSRRAIADATSIRPDRVRVIIDGEESIVPAEEVPVGTETVLHPGERAAIDSVVVSGEAFVDCSAITGESMPVGVKAGDTVLSGYVDTDGLLILKTTAEFNTSAASRILKLVEEAAETRGETETMISRFAGIYTPTVLILAMVLAFLPPLLGFGSLITWVSRALIFLVASCPCAFVISVPLTFLSGLGAISRKGVLIKGTVYLEALARTDAALFDKTGTLTSGNARVTEFKPLNGADEQEVLALAYAAEKDSEHPAAKAVCAYCGGTGEILRESFREIPGRGISMEVNGEEILCGSASLLSQNGISAPEGFDVYLSRGNIAIGAFSLTDEPREGAVKALESLRALGFGTLGMLTGDSQANADSVAREIGIDFAKGSLLPQDKAACVAKVKNSGKHVIFVGDGINDAPVLAAADVGFAMGLGTDAAIETADAVLMSERLESLADAVALSRRTVKKAKENIIFALVVKFAVLILGVFGMAEMWMAVFADVGVTLIAVLNAASLLKAKKS